MDESGHSGDAGAAESGTGGAARERNRVNGWPGAESPWSPPGVVPETDDDGPAWRRPGAESRSFPRSPAFPAAAPSSGPPAPVPPPPGFVNAPRPDDFPPPGESAAERWAESRSRYADLLSSRMPVPRADPLASRTPLPHHGPTSPPAPAGSPSAAPSSSAAHAGPLSSPAHAGPPSSAAHAGPPSSAAHAGPLSSPAHAGPLSSPVSPPLHAGSPSSPVPPARRAGPGGGPARETGPAERPLLLRSFDVPTPNSAPPYPYEGDLDDAPPAQRAPVPMVRPATPGGRHGGPAGPEPARHALDAATTQAMPRVEAAEEARPARPSYDANSFPRRSPSHEARPAAARPEYVPPAAYAAFDRGVGATDPRPAAPATRMLPQRVPAQPDVPRVPEPPLAEPSAETPALARIATHLRRGDVLPAQEREEGFDVQAILGAVREVDGVRDASLRTTPTGAHSLRLDLAEGADPAEVSRQVARLLQERMGLDAAMQGESPPVVPAPATPPPAIPRATAPVSPAATVGRARPVSASPAPAAPVAASSGVASPAPTAATATGGPSSAAADPASPARTGAGSPPAAGTEATGPGAGSPAAAAGTGSPASAPDAGSPGSAPSAESSAAGSSASGVESPASRLGPSVVAAGSPAGAPGAGPPASPPEAAQSASVPGAGSPRAGLRGVDPGAAPAALASPAAPAAAVAKSSAPAPTAEVPSARLAPASPSAASQAGASQPPAVPPVAASQASVASPVAASQASVASPAAALPADTAHAPTAPPAAGSPASAAPVRPAAPAPRDERRERPDRDGPGGAVEPSGVDHRPPRPLYPGEYPGPRVMIENVHVNTFGTDATVSVRLSVGGRTAAGEATGPAVDGYLMRLCATATAGAVDQLLAAADHPEGPARCFVEHAAAVPFGASQVAVVVLLLSWGGWVEQLAGSAVVTGDDRHAMVRATLAAVNRRLEALLTR